MLPYDAPGKPARVTGAPALPLEDLERKSMGRLIPLLALLFALTACASQPMRVLNPADGSPRLAAAADGIRATGGGSASGRGWDRRLLVSLTLRNERAEALRLARDDLILAIGPRRVSPRTLVGSAKTGSVESITLPAGGTRELMAEFSANFAIKNRGTIRLRFEKVGGGNVVKLEVPLKLDRVPDLEDLPATMDRAQGGPDPGGASQGDGPF
jgi:hypothetical protein